MGFAGMTYQPFSTILFAHLDPGTVLFPGSQEQGEGGRLKNMEMPPCCLFPRSNKRILEGTHLQLWTDPQSHIPGWHVITKLLTVASCHQWYEDHRGHHHSLLEALSLLLFLPFIHLGRICLWGGHFLYPNVGLLGGPWTPQAASSPCPQLHNPARRSDFLCPGSHSLVLLGFAWISSPQ